MAERWLKRGPCPDCGSSDANVQHSDGHSFCFSCNTRFSNKDNEEEMNYNIEEKDFDDVPPVMTNV